jgi:hypothetical protein
MLEKTLKFLKTPVFASDKSRCVLRIIKRILLFISAVFLSAISLHRGVYLMEARIDMWQELQMITKTDLFTGPIGSLIVFLFAHEYLPKGKVRRFAIFFYLILALFISSWFLMLHINQVSVRGGQSQIAIIRSLFMNDR